MENQLISKLCPETCIIFVSYGRADIAASSYASLSASIAPYRDRIKIVISDATDDEQKMRWAKNTDADDVILTPRFTPSASSRNLAMTLILDKYAPGYLCMLEDDYLYHPDWYPSLVETANRLYGVLSPLSLAYGIFTACDHHIPPECCMKDNENKVTAYAFGAVAYQRFMPTSHYLSVMRNWESDLLGTSFAQSGGQTFRNTMRGFCGAIIPGKLTWPLDVKGELSTWRGRRHPGPRAHSFELNDYDVIRKEARRAGEYERSDRE